jgi:hypothetical protein
MILRAGKIIEIVTHEDGRRNVRRVKITRARKSRVLGCNCGDPDCEGNGEEGTEYKWVIKAGNLHGKYERSYTLPLEPIAATDIRNPAYHDSVNWVVPTDLDGASDP